MKNWKQKCAKYSMKIKQYGGTIDIVCTFGSTGIVKMPDVLRDYYDINIIIKEKVGFTTTDPNFFIIIANIIIFIII